MDRVEKRIQVVTLKKEGYPLRYITQKTGVSRRGVQKICKRFLETNSYKDKPRSGRPEKLSEREKRIIVNILKRKEAKTATKIQETLNTSHDIVVSRKTVARTLNSFGYQSVESK